MECYIHGQYKNKEELTEEEKRDKNAIKTREARKNEIMKILNGIEGEEAQETLHRMFDGMKLEFNPTFYKFFTSNIKEILENTEVQGRLPDIQREIDRIREKYRTTEITIGQCTNYLKESQSLKGDDSVRLSEVIEEYIKEMLRENDEFVEFRKK